MNAHLLNGLKLMLVVWRSIAGATVVALLTLASPVLALDGQIGIHDPSTVIQCDGKFYVFADPLPLPAPSASQVPRQ